MKKLFCVLVAIFATISLFANMQGHFFMHVEDENVQVANVESHFAQWLDLPVNTTFSLFRDETDNLGIRHLSYQQYVNGTIIQNGMVLVHAKNGIVNTINGDIMDATIAAQQLPQRIEPQEAAKKVHKKANASDAQLKIIRANIDGKDVYRYAYEVITDDFSSKKYVDAETGQVIKDIPLKYNADVSGTVTTMYNGTQAITCYEENGSYYLIDQGRNIYTLDATNNTYNINYQTNDGEQELMNVINACSLISNSSPNFASTWDFQLKSITISTILQNSTWYIVGEGQADVYLKIRDKNNNLLYTSGYKENPTLPATFNITTHIGYSSLPLSVEVWDYDPIGDDDLVDIFIIDTYGGNMLSRGWVGVGSYTDGTYTSIAQGVQPHFDAHWGMEKTLDFYSQKLNRNSYDNQGSVVYQVVNIPRDEGLLANLPLNAFAVKLGVHPMVYGTGLLSTNSALADACSRPLVSIDIMAHEFTHCVTNKNGNGGLDYTGESGALNESFSDIIGIAVKNFATGQNDWLIGSDIVVNASNMRSMKNPNNSYDGRTGVLSSPQPKTYYDNLYWVDPASEEDHGGIHTNSGVQNYWFYLLSEGGSGTNDVNSMYNVVGIGIDKAVQIAYRNLIYYLTPEATHEDARNGSIQAAIDLYGQDSQEHQSVANAWHAVGVGNKYGATQESITIKAIMPSNWGTTISAWVWEDGSEGHWETLEKEGEWYTFTSIVTPLNIVYVNGSTWNGDNNQTVDIRVAESTCIQLNSNTGKRTYSIIDCDEFEEPTEYYIVAKRNSGNYYFFTPSKVSGKNRLIAVDAGTSVRANIDTIHTTVDYLWTFENNKLKSHNGQYLACTAAKSAIMNTTGTELTKTDNSDGSVTFSYLTDTETRYLSLATSGNDYYVFYANANQFTHLYMLPKGQESTTQVSVIDANNQAQKILHNGQILILRGEKVYTLTGQEVR